MSFLERSIGSVAVVGQLDEALACLVAGGFHRLDLAGELRVGNRSEQCCLYDWSISSLVPSCTKAGLFHCSTSSAFGRPL